MKLARKVSFKSFHVYVTIRYFLEKKVFPVSGGTERQREIGLCKSHYRSRTLEVESTNVYFSSFFLSISIVVFLRLYCA